MYVLSTQLYATQIKPTREVLKAAALVVITSLLAPLKKNNFHANIHPHPLPNSYRAVAGDVTTV